MNKQTADRLRDVIKSMKADIIIIGPNLIIGNNNELCNLKSINFTAGIPYYYVFTISEIIELIPTFFNDNLQFLPEGIMLNNEVIHYNNMGLVNTICSIYNRATSYNTVLYRHDNLHQEPEFGKLLSMKVGDGLGRYTRTYTLNFTANRLFLSIFTNLIPLNKADKLDMEILYVDEVSFMCHFIIHKKTHDIHQYIRYKSL